MKNAQTTLVPLVLFSVLFGRVDDVGAQTMSRCLGIRIDAFLDFPVPDEDTSRELLAYDQQLCAILALPSVTAQDRRFAYDGMEGWVAYRSICARGDVVQSFRNGPTGQIALAAERFCREVSATAPEQQRVVAGTAVVELGVEAFCLVVDNATDPGGVAALIGPERKNLPSVVRLRAVGDSLARD